MKNKKLEQEYVDSYRKEPPLLFVLLIALGTLFLAFICILIIYGVAYLILSNL